MTVLYSHTAVIESTPTAAKPFLVYREFAVEWLRPDQPPIRFMVFAGFDTDLASIPRPFRNLVSQFAGIQQAIAHDFAYRGHTTLTKAEADRLFYEGLRTPGSGVSRFKAELMYLAVKVGGRGAWTGMDQEDKR